MKLRKISDNCVEINTDNCSLLFSYTTLVGACVYGQGFYVTDVRYSSTTSKHINAWLEGRKAEKVSQQWLNDWVIAVPPLKGWTKG